MPELFIELFSEEIPARMQARAAEDLARLVGEALAAISPTGSKVFFGPRRIAMVAEVAPDVAATTLVERGPRIAAPEQALAGFLRKHNAAREDVRQEGEFWMLERVRPAVSAAALIAGALPALLRRFPWPKSMRWGASSGFTWVRPLRRICCLLDGATVAFDLAQPGDDGHGLKAENVTEGHRFHAPGPVAVTGCESWQAALRERQVLVSAEERRALIGTGIAALAAAHGLTVVEDAGLLDEVAGLVEWPVPLLGRIDSAYMDLPPEVMQVSMRVNQRYFALRTDRGAAAPWFAFAANIAAADGGAAIVAGNERVLRARFSDARHFWDLDRQTTLADRVAALDAVVFHAGLGTQGARARRLETLAGAIAAEIGADPALAARAGLLAKADLTTGMVGEFPELQGVMGGYYAAHDGEHEDVAAAIREQYLPKGPGDRIPTAPVAIACALADKLDQLAGFFSIGEKPSGSGDPYALRRAALGVIRIIRENRLRLKLRGPLAAAAKNVGASQEIVQELIVFIGDRLRIQLRAEGARHDVLAAAFSVHADDDLIRLMARSDAISALLGTTEGRDLLAGYRRAVNILRIEDRRDGPHDGAADPSLFQQGEENSLHDAITQAGDLVALIVEERFEEAMGRLARLRAPIDAFFEKVTVNADDVALRKNRLGLLAQIRTVMNQVADFALIE
jgi:glycyl-tRNA synthetase beta chain